MTGISLFLFKWSHIVKYPWLSSSSSKMDHETCVNSTRLDSFEKFGFGDLFDLTLTLTWAKYENNSLASTFAQSLGVHMESVGRKMLRLRSLRSATWKHSILTFDLIFTWHVTSILNFRNCFERVSSRSFECRLAHLSTTIRFRDSTGGRIRPPVRWWVQKQPRRWRINWNILVLTTASRNETRQCWVWFRLWKNYIYLKKKWDNRDWKDLVSIHYRKL